jgi:tRNA nucleotidyltransferase/poly(A) polymerase
MNVFAVGGSVRDFLMGLPSNDNDFVVVGATDKEMRDAGFMCTGAFFPVYLHPETGEEYALARKEKKSGVGHTAFTVEFDPAVTLEEDLARRDLTINAMAMDAETGALIDPYDGQLDLMDEVLRHVSDAFAEDPLRVIRLARFYARFDNFQIAQETLDLAKSIVTSGEMDALSTERYWAEFDKMFASTQHPARFIYALWQMGVFEHVSFFNKMFGSDIGSTKLNRLYTIAESVMGIKEEDRTMFFIALASANNAPMERATVETANLSKAVWAARSLPVYGMNGKVMMSFLSSMGAANRESKTLNNMIRLLAKCAFAVGPGVNAFSLSSCADIAYSVKSTDEMFADIEGIALGQAMFAEKVKRLDKELL